MAQIYIESSIKSHVMQLISIFIFVGSVWNVASMFYRTLSY